MNATAATVAPNGDRIELVREPAPATCVACGGPLEPWWEARPQEPSLRQLYMLFRCERCGTASTAGAPDPELYETGVYAIDSTRLSGPVEWYRRVYERHKLSLLRRSLPPPARVLEVGAGQGRFVALARAAGYDAQGIEPSPHAVRVAAANGVELRLSTLEDAVVEPGSLDGILFWHVLEHLDDPGPALDRLAEWLRPGGAMLLGVPNIASLQAAIGGGRWSYLDVPRHRQHFTPRGLRTLLSRHRFEVEREVHLLVEHNPFGMWQTWLERATTTPSYVYNLVKHNARVTARDMVPTLLVAALAPLAVAVEAIAGLLRHGGTIAVIARRR